MQIPWRAKSFAFALIDLFRLSPLLYFAQKNVTKRSRRAVKQAHPHWQFHAANLAQLQAPKVLEFGAGKSLAQNIYLSPFCGSQLLVDLNPMLDPGLVDAAAQSISHIAPVTYKKIANTNDLAAYNITYKAPVDVSRTGLPDSSLDACISTSTLEHIPEESLRAILKELRRVLRPGGVLRVGLPDLERAIEAWLRQDKAYFYIPDDETCTLGGKLIVQAIWYGSTRTPFTWDFFHELATKAGFREVTRCKFRHTAGPWADIVELDNRERETLFVESVN
jgi:SAM-dependent methyltransferase